MHIHHGNARSRGATKHGGCLVHCSNRIYRRLKILICVTIVFVHVTKIARFLLRHNGCFARGEQRLHLLAPHDIAKQIGQHVKVV